jgi:hypothetical protein
MNTIGLWALFYDLLDVLRKDEYARKLGTSGVGGKDHVPIGKRDGRLNKGLYPGKKRYGGGDQI